jgi:hypothetical protein
MVMDMACGDRKEQTKVKEDGGFEGYRVVW